MLTLYHYLTPPGLLILAYVIRVVSRRFLNDPNCNGAIFLIELQSWLLLWHWFTAFLALQVLRFLIRPHWSSLVVGGAFIIKPQGAFLYHAYMVVQPALRFLNVKVNLSTLWMLVYAACIMYQMRTQYLAIHVLPFALCCIEVAKRKSRQLKKE